jgi:hypothetical protein
MRLMELGFNIGFSFLLSSQAGGGRGVLINFNVILLKYGVFDV